MTWKEFKETVESKGVKDNMTVDYIDFSTGWGEVDVNIDDDDSVSISD